jgi:hypothetical protein
MRVLHDFDQGDVEKLRSITSEFHPEGIDIVFDDASHLYDLTKATMSVLFPKLNPGGYYVLEDYWTCHGLMPLL